MRRLSGRIAIVTGGGGGIGGATCRRLAREGAAVGVLDLDQMRRQAKTFNELGVIPKDVSGQIDTVWDAELLKEVM